MVSSVSARLSRFSFRTFPSQCRFRGRASRCRKNKTKPKTQHHNTDTTTTQTDKHNAHFFVTEHLSQALDHPTTSLSQGQGGGRHDGRCRTQHYGQRRYQSQAPEPTRHQHGGGDSQGRLRCARGARSTTPGSSFRRTASTEQFSLIPGTATRNGRRPPDPASPARQSPLCKFRIHRQSL